MFYAQSVTGPSRKNLRGKRLLIEGFKKKNSLRERIVRRELQSPSIQEERSWISSTITDAITVDLSGSKSKKSSSTNRPRDFSLLGKAIFSWPPTRTSKCRIFLFKRNPENGIWDIVCPSCARYFPAVDEDIKIINQVRFHVVCPYCWKLLILIAYLSAERFDN